MRRIVPATPVRSLKLARAPGPEAVNWAAIWTNAPARAARKYPAAIAFAAIIIFPIGFFTGALGISQP